MGLLAGDRPTADVDVLAGAVAVVEYELARRMHAASTAGSLPLVGPGAVLAARGWAGPHARRLARAGALAAEHPTVAAAWGRGSSPPITWTRSPATWARWNPTSWPR